MVNEGSAEEFVDTLIGILQMDAYATKILYEPLCQRRCAQVKREYRPLYKGKLYKAVQMTLGYEAPAWDREIDVWVYSQDRLITVPLSSIADEDVSWLWEPYVPYKKLTLVEGDPEGGKTYLLLAISAAVTKGLPLPDQLGLMEPGSRKPGNVLYITAEDGLADTIKKRARKCGADLDRIFVIPTASMFPEDMQPFSLARPHLLSAAIEEREAKLVILDPLTAFLGATVDMHRANEVRPLMTTLVGIADKHNCAMVAIRHWTKAVGGKASYRGQGNVDFLAAARCVLSVGESPEDERLRLMAQSKNSLVARGTSILFEISDSGLHWAGTSTLTADELSAAQPNKHQHQRKDAMQWLKDFLKTGPQPATNVTIAADLVGISDRTLRRAREHLHILTTKDAGVWYWRLPNFHKWERERYPGQEDEE